MSSFSWPVAAPANGIAAQPTWWKVTLPHTAFQTAGLTKSVAAFSVPARSVIHMGIVKPSVQFAGTMLTYTVSLGIAGSLAKYAVALNVLQAPGDSVLASALLSLPADVPAFSGPASVVATAVSTIATLDQSTAGSVDCWLLVSVLP